MQGFHLGIHKQHRQVKKNQYELKRMFFTGLISLSFSQNVCKAIFFSKNSCICF